MQRGILNYKLSKYRMRYSARGWIMLLTAVLSIELAIAMGASYARPARNWISNLVVNPEYSTLVGSTDPDTGGVIVFWSLASGKSEHEISVGYKEWVRDMVVSPEGNHLAVTLLKSDDIGCYSIKGKKWLWRRKLEGSGAGSSIQFALNGKHIIFMGLKEIVTYDVLTGNVSKRERSPSEIRKGYSCLSTAGRYAAAWGPRWGHNDDFWGPLGALRPKWAFVFDIEKQTTILDTARWLRPFKSCGGTFSPDDQYLLLGSMDGVVRAWTIADGKVVKEWQAYGDGAGLPLRSAVPNPVDSLVFSADGRYLATIGSEEGTTAYTHKVKIWDFSRGSLLKTFDNVTGGIFLCGNYPMAFSADGKLFALQQHEKACLYDTDTWKERWCVPAWLEGK